MEPVDSSSKDVSKKNKPVPLMISNPKLLDCLICFQPLSIPVLQCDNGHIVCSTCIPKTRIMCHKCLLPINSKRCKTIENLLLSTQMPCPNEKHGCREKISYTQKRKHEEECIHGKCYCPLSGCDFVASSKVLSKHFSYKHEDSQIKFSYGHSFVVSLKSTDETIVLQEEIDGKLFILNNSAMLLGNAVNIYGIGPNSSESEYSYDILARSQICKLKLQSFAKDVQRVTLAPLSSEFLVIPFGSSKPPKLEICITCITPRMIIFIMFMKRKTFRLRVQSSDTIVSVKEKLFDIEDIPVHQQHMTFACKKLDDNQTLDDYNILENSTIDCILRFTGD